MIGAVSRDQAVLNCRVSDFLPLLAKLFMDIVLLVFEICEFLHKLSVLWLRTANGISCTSEVLVMLSFFLIRKHCCAKNGSLFHQLCLL